MPGTPDEITRGNDDMAAALVRGLVELITASPEKDAAADELIKIGEQIKALKTPTRN